MASQATPNLNTFLLPDLGEGLEEAELLEWCVSEGQEVKESDMLAKMETAKAVVDGPCVLDRSLQELVVAVVDGQHHDVLAWLTRLCAYLVV